MKVRNKDVDQARLRIVKKEIWKFIYSQINLQLTSVTVEWFCRDGRQKDGDVIGGTSGRSLKYSKEKLIQISNKFLFILAKKVAFVGEVTIGKQDKNLSNKV